MTNLFIKEFEMVSPEVQEGFLRLVEEREIGEYRLFGGFHEDGIAQTSDEIDAIHAALRELLDLPPADSHTAPVGGVIGQNEGIAAILKNARRPSLDGDT